MGPPPVKYLPILSDPTEEDSDGDDLYDGQAHYLSAQDFTMPIDPMPLTKTYFPKFGTEEYKSVIESYDLPLPEYDDYSYNHNYYLFSVRLKEAFKKNANTRIANMMSDVNNCSYTYLISDENWLEFC